MAKRKDEPEVVADDRVKALEEEVKALQDALAAATAPTPKTTTVYEKDGTPNVQNFWIDEGGNRHHYSP